MRQQVGEIEFGATKIGYLIERSRNRSTIAITVHPDGTVSVVAPKGTRRTRISGAVVGKAKWILEQQEYFRRQHNGYAKLFVSGESFFYLGRQYKLKVEQSQAKEIKPQVCLMRGQLLVTVPKDSHSRKRAIVIRQCLINWYRDRAGEHIPKIVARYASSLGLNCSSIQIREMRKRWGSGGRSGCLIFNWRTIMAPRRLVEYVVAHELCHLKYDDHSRDFWQLLERVMPDYEQRKMELAEIGRKFELPTCSEVNIHPRG